MTPSIKAILVDDEQKARNLLKGMIIAFTPHVDIVTECEDVPSAIKAIHKYQPELVFLDIEMPGYSGLECKLP
jgi:two-component system LytT family response regulator